MKLFLLLPVIALALLTGCQHPPAAGEQQDTSAIAVDSPPDPLPAPTEKVLDTLHLGPQELIVYLSDKATYDSYPAVPDIDLDSSSEKKRLLRDTTVKRIADTLYIKLANGKDTILRNNETDDDTYVSYQYVADYPEINCKGFFVGYYEASGFLLVNTQTGKGEHCWDAPVLSPDRNLLMVPSEDLVAAFNPNGLQLYRVNKNTVTLIGETELKNWAAGRMKWINQHTILTELITVDGNYERQVNYAKIILR